MGALFRFFGIGIVAAIILVTIGGGDIAPIGTGVGKIVGSVLDFAQGIAVGYDSPTDGPGGQ